MNAPRPPPRAGRATLPHEDPPPPTPTPSPCNLYKFTRFLRFTCDPFTVFSSPPPPPPSFLPRVTCTSFKHQKRMTARAACKKSSRLLETSTLYPVPKRLVHGKPEIGHRYGGARGGGGGGGGGGKKPLLPPIAKSAYLPSENICLQCQDEGRYYGRLYFLVCS